MTKEVDEQIGSKIGVVEEVEVDEDGIGWDPYLRAKAAVNITKPLMRGILLNLQGNTYWIVF